MAGEAAEAAAHAARWRADCAADGGGRVGARQCSGGGAVGGRTRSEKFRVKKFLRGAARDAASGVPRVGGGRCRPRRRRCGRCGRRRRPRTPMEVGRRGRRRGEGGGGGARARSRRRCGGGRRRRRARRATSRRSSTWRGGRWQQAQAIVVPRRDAVAVGGGRSRCDGCRRARALATTFAPPAVAMAFDRGHRRPQRQQRGRGRGARVQP